MGKRTKSKTEDEIRKKIRRLEEELRNRENVPPHGRQPQDGEDYDYSTSPYNYHEELELDAYGSVVSSVVYEVDNHSEEQHSPECSPAVLDEMECERRCEDAPDTAAEAANVESQQPSTKPVAEQETSLPTEILAILGEAKRAELFGKKIPSDISERWGQILLEGLAKEQKEILINKSLIPENFQLIKAPKLNPEVASVLTDPAKNRDKRLEKMQNQLGAGLAGLVDLTAELIGKDMNKIYIIKKLSETNQILVDLHYEETMNRRRLIIPMLDKKFINIIHGVKRDEFLFGEKLGENIKNSKSIEQSSLQIKKPGPPPPNLPRKLASQQGNLRAPSRGGRLPGPARAPAHYRYNSGYSYPPPPPAARRPPLRRPQLPPPSSSRPQDHRHRR